MPKYIFVTGAYVRGLGKGIAGASIGMLLKAAGFTVAMQKARPVFERGSGHDEPVSARRGVRDA